MYINTFQYTPEEVKCTLCARYSCETGCMEESCPWLAERIEAGVVGYEEAVLESFSKDPSLGQKLQSIVQSFPGSLYLDAAHRTRMNTLRLHNGSVAKRDTPAYYAAMYLLTADQDLYSRTLNCFGGHGIQFVFAHLRGIEPHAYTLFSAAQDIYTDEAHVLLSDLADRESVDTLAFSLIVNALLVARYGPAVLEITERMSV